MVLAALLGLLVVITAAPCTSVARPDTYVEAPLGPTKRARSLKMLFTETSANQDVQEEVEERFHANPVVSSQDLHTFAVKQTGSHASEAEIEQLLAQVKRDLEPWEKEGVSLEMVERLYCNEESSLTMRIQVVNGTAYIAGLNPSWQGRSAHTQRQILDLTERYQLPDVDIMISTADSCKDWGSNFRQKNSSYTPCNVKNAPLFSYDRNAFQTSCVRMPDFSWGGWPEAHMPNWQSTRAWMLNTAERTPYEDRENKLFWRGGDTNSQRRILDSSRYLQESPIADVHLMHWLDGKERFEREFVSLPEHCQYKQLLHLAGFSWSARLRALLLCGSPILFPFDTDWEPQEFWYHLLQDGHNIILTGKVTDVNEGRNVIEKAEELFQNESYAQEIGRNGQYLAAEILHPENIQRYWMELLTQYSEMQTFRPTVHKDAVPLEIAMMKPQKTMPSRDRFCNLC